MDDIPSRPVGSADSPSGVLAAVSKAFSCLSDPDQRAAYDRYGEDGAPVSRARANGHYAQQGFTEFDAEELFNMFFNGGGPRPG